MAKLQKLQNRCLRTCFDIYDPMEIGTVRLHEMARVNLLSTRHDLQLLTVMFSFKLNNKYKKESTRVTRSTERYEFKTEILHKYIYAKSPFYKVYVYGIIFHWIALHQIIHYLKDKIGVVFFRCCVIFDTL